jgi:hypothetical protein
MAYTSNDFTLLIGEGLTAFGHVEMELAKLFATAARCKDPKTAERIFWAVNSLETRLAMTGAALKSAFAIIDKKSELPAQWNALAEKLKSKQKERAELAHGNVMHMPWQTKRGARTDLFFAPFYGKSTVDKTPPTFRRIGYDPRPKRRLYIPDLEQRRVDFMTLRAEIANLVVRLRQELGAALAQTEDQAILRGRSFHRVKSPTPKGSPKPQTPSAE